MDDIFITDGYTATRTIDAVPGLHPALRVVYRPALAPVRLGYRVLAEGRDPEAIAKRENELIAKYVLTINGASVPAEKAATLKPSVRSYLLDLVLGYAAADEEADLKNS